MSVETYYRSAARRLIIPAEADQQLNYPWSIANFEQTGKVLLLPYLVEEDYPELYSQGYPSKLGSQQRGFQFSNSGTKFFLLTRSGPPSITQWEMDEPYDIENAVYKKRLLPYDLESEEFGNWRNPKEGVADGAHGLYVRKNDGKMVYAFTRRSIWQYELDEAWEIDTAETVGYFSFPDADFDIYDDTPATHDITISRDGRFLYIDQRRVFLIHQYEMTTPWDITTLEKRYVFDVTYGVDDPYLALRGTEFDPTGYKLFILECFNHYIREYHLTEPWNLETAEFVSRVSINDSEKYSFKWQAVSMDWAENGMRFYVVDTKDGHDNHHGSSTDPYKDDAFLVEYKIINNR